MGRCQKVPKFDFLSQLSMPKIIRIFLNFFSLKNINLGALFLSLIFFHNINLRNDAVHTSFQVPHFVNWSIKARGHAFSSGGWAYDLCLTEKLVILTANQNSMLNKRDELLETCRHQRKHLLVSLIKPPKKKEPPDTAIK